MEELLVHLERQIKELIDQHHQLKQSNQRLHDGQYMLSHEKELLLAKHKNAISHIQALISRLKSLERST